MTPELKQLIEDAAKLLGLTVKKSKFLDFVFLQDGQWVLFNPLDPERGDLMKVADAAKLCIDGRENEYFVYYDDECIHEPAWFRYEKDDHDSLALAILRAASAVLKARGE